MEPGMVLAVAFAVPSQLAMALVHLESLEICLLVDSFVTVVCERDH